MPASTASLESLSSPSPSPPPPEEHHSNHSGAAGLDSGSELSELTDDEQDNDNRTNEDDASRTSSRKKRLRDRIVPAPMWDWAYKPKKSEKKDKSDWRNKPAEEEEEEEEEEQAGPAKAMEEEEDDDQDKHSNPDRHTSSRKSRVSSDDADDNDNDIEDDPPEEDGESAGEASSRRGRKDTSGNVSAEEEDDLEDAEHDAPDADVDRTPKVAASPDLTDDENDNENDNVDEEEVEDEDQAGPIDASKDASDVEDDEDDPEAKLPPDDADGDQLDGEEPPTTGAVTPAEGFADPAEGDADATMDIDAPPPVLMSPVAVAASSIMAGSTIIQLESPGSSQPSTPSASRMSSRYPSADREQEPDVASEPEAEPEPERKPSSGRAPRSRNRRTRTRAARRSRAAAAAEAGEADGDVEQVEGVEGENGDGDDMDVATPELDLDSDMQPAHRAEALDELAAIELKFALLRERLYVEKMDTLAWEEGLIADGTHPELLHLHAELSKRRDKRLELASRRRDYEVANVTKRRKLDEEGVWSWWKDARDELQMEMISETNSKRRRLERERRALERPQPSRRFPLPPVEVPPPPTLREIVKSSPFGIPEAALPHLKHLRRKRAPPPGSTLIYPQITSLSPGEIVQDLDLFFQHRRAAVGFDPHRGGPGLMNSVLGGLPPPGMDPYALGMQVLDGPAGNRFAAPFHQPHLHTQGLVQGFAAQPPRLPHHHSAPPGTLPHIGHSQMQLEQEMAMGMQPPSGIPQHPPHLQQQLGQGSLMRRSISPVPLSNGTGPSSGIPNAMGGGPLPPGFAGPKLNGWTGPPTGVHMSSRREVLRANSELEGRERERDRERIGELRERERGQRDVDREREAERAYHMSQSQPRHIPHQHTHQHVHSTAQGQGVHGHHHLHHHHHVRHHHHTPHQTLSGPSGMPHANPITGSPSGSNVGHAATNKSHSPHSGRESRDQRRVRSGAPTEIIELSASSQITQTGASPTMTAFWQGKDESLRPDGQREFDRERGRALPGPPGLPPPGPQERLVTPFTMGPSQQLRGSPRPGSPRGPPGHQHLPASMPSSRRGSWSAGPEDLSLARPPSTSHAPPAPGMAAGSSTQRSPSSRIPHQPSAPSFHSPFGSPPYSNGRAPPLPPANPPASSFIGTVSSPGRSGQSGRGPAGGPVSPPPLASAAHSPRFAGSAGGSKISSRARLPSPQPGKGLGKLEGFPVPEGGNISPIVAGTGGASDVAAVGQGSTLLPPLSTTLSPAGVSRLSNGALSEKSPAHLSGTSLPTKAVPVDGS
ncbi:hypothetical protein BD414DRAFT_486298 [Trametes punicea]|nr:hypothetical protein BD414DRAFT_486298 [Trametes punicea]